MKSRFGKKGYFCLFAGALILLLAACAPATAPPAPAPGGPAAGVATPTPSPKRGGTVAYACINAPNNLNPYIVAAAADRRGVGPVYESLVSWEFKPGLDHRIDYKVIPWLAESWEQPNATTYLMHIRKGVQWQDGTDFTAEDVVWSYSYANDPKNAFGVRGRLKSLDSIELVDKYTLRITTKGPSPMFLSDLADQAMMVLSKHLFDRGEDFKKVAIGTGPFKLKDWSPTRSSVFVRNENYWQKDRPYPNGVECIYGLDTSAQIAAFVAKKIDFIHLNSRGELDTLKMGVPDVQYGQFIGDYGPALYMKLDKPPFGDIRVRRAMHLAIDRQSLLKLVTFGDGVIDPPGVQGNKTGWAIPQEELLKLPGYRQPKDEDMAEAKRLLAEAGYPDGFKATVRVARDRISAPRALEPTVAQLKKIGVDLTIDGMPQAAYLAAEKAGDYDIVMAHTFTMNMKDTWDYLHSQGAFNSVGINDPRLDELLEVQRSEMSLDKRKQAALEMQRLLLEKLYIIPTIDLAVYAAWQPWVHDYVYNFGSAAFVDMATASRIWLDVDQMPSDRR